MGLAIQLCAYLIGIPLQILTISVLLRGLYKRFPVVFLYTIISFLTSIVEMPLSFNFLLNQRKPPPFMKTVWFTDEVVLQVMVFAVVISLIYEATARMESRRMLRMALACGAFLAAGISFALEYTPGALIGPWMTPWSRDLKLCATILVLALWAFLISTRRKDHLLLMLSGALGVLCTGEAIGESLRYLATPGRIIWLSRLGGIINTTVDTGFLYIWWSALRAETPERPKPRTA
jgi:hypothetical protein